MGGALDEGEAPLMATAVKPSYVLEHDWELEPRRLQLLEEHADPVTVHRLEATGIDAGWDCLEIGAGRGSIAQWLAHRVGATGSVVALDLETSLLDWLDEEPNVEVVCGDVLEIDLPENSLDLVHARLVLMHIPERRRVLERIARWLRPGGWLVAEELDSMAVLSDPDPDRVALFRAFDQALPTIDFQCGRELLDELAAAGLVDTAADVRVDVVEGATPLAQWEQLSIQAVTEHALDAGTATVEQIEAHLAQLEDPDYRALGWAWIGVQGRRNGTPRINGSAAFAS
jgi:SAM-dependent methyltransferase